MKVPAALVASDLTFTYPGAVRPALEGLSLRVEEGAFTGLLGPNGAGKTTFVHLVCGLLRPSGGRMTVFGHAGGSRQARRAIGLCPQELALYPTLTAAENLRFFGRLAGLRGRSLAARVDACLDVASLSGEARSRAGRFSGGMKRRLNLAAALVHQPRLLLLDEPTAGVDAQSRLAIFDTLERLSASGTTIVYTTHYMEEVERLCKDVIVIDHGRVLTAAPRGELAARGRRAQVFRLSLAADGDAAALARDAEGRGLRARAIGRRELELAGEELPVLLAEVSRLTDRGEVVACESRRPSLEEGFLELTGEGLRD